MVQLLSQPRFPPPPFLSAAYRGHPVRPGTKKNDRPFLVFMVSSLRRGHANLLCFYDRFIGAAFAASEKRDAGEEAGRWSRPCFGYAQNISGPIWR